jgi:hypothetical protein
MKLFWITRFLAVLFICFITIFAFDTPIFSIGFLIHLIPTFILIITTLIAWKNGKIGGIIFIVLFLISILFFNSYKNISNFLIVSFPLLIIGLLFFKEKKHGK